MRGLVLLLLGGCFAPIAPVGASCDPAAPICPGGQRCFASGEDYRCLREPPLDVDAAVTSDVPDAEPGHNHVRTVTGWSSTVFRDFSAEFAYVAQDFVDDSPTVVETYDNAPDQLFVLQPPFAEALAVIAGRKVIEVTRDFYIEHDFGQHDNDRATIGPDAIVGGTQAAMAGAPAVLLSSSSLNGGDGLFAVTPAWAISNVTTQNGVRCAVGDPAGAFDATGAAEIYVGVFDGLYRRPDETTPIVTGNIRTMRLVGHDLLITRDLTSSFDLLRVATGTHAVSVLLNRSDIRIAEGSPPAPFVAWLVLDRSQLALLDADGSISVIAESLDPAFEWKAAAAPASPHALAGAVYVLESHRGRDLDRLLAISATP